ncbi:MAG: hypothetical protein CMO80_11580 [Verrucomicrobiales bacterium]|nr:hypothetical protein [Verrucomicrobiales bacterium]|tara:strand:+ start:4873 stop:6900 length:2028 start_codon:yes stop_codon:yes gene_type:complete
MIRLSFALCVLICSLPVVKSAGQVIADNTYFLGTPGFPEWEENVGRKAHGRELHLDFESKANPKAKTLLIQQEGVKEGWSVYLNGKRLGGLVRSQTRLVHHLEVPERVMKDGTNKLSIRAPKRIDDINVGPIRLRDGAKRFLAEGWLETRLFDESGQMMPGRVTIADENGAQAALYLDGAPKVIGRAGVVYTGHGYARVGLPEGTYDIWGSRGFEYSIAKRRVKIRKGHVTSVDLHLNREVDTRGWVSVDSHIHTLTFSGHGDSTLDERMLTISGEGIEVAISTDHNHHTDFHQPAVDLGVRKHFTPVVGNEVTTKIGHLNSFPMKLDASIPPYKLTNWVELLEGIRSSPGVQVVQLNHPRNVHSGFSPTATNVFDRVTGRSGMGVGYDAMEVVTSAAMQSDPMCLFRDWFALLNRGHRIVGMGSSDTHDVSRFILGQARTYIRAKDEDSGAIDVDELCDSLLDGKASISFGLLAEIDVNGASIGDVIQTKDGKVRVTIEVIGPSWVCADRVELFANGISIGRRDFTSGSEIRKGRFVFDTQIWNDAYLVAIATGPGLREPFWDTPRPYQLSSKKFTPRLIAATNPVWVDADGDGRVNSPRAVAEQALEKAQHPVAALKSIALKDAAVAVQMAEFLAARIGKDELKRAVPKEAINVRAGVNAYLSGRAEELYIRR